MVINPHGPGSCDFVTELFELSKTKKTVIYPALFVTPPEIAMVIKALALAEQKITAILYDPVLEEAKPVPDLKNKLREEGFDFVDLNAVKQFQDENPDVEIIILSNHIPPKQDFVYSTFGRLGINCRMYHFFDIPHSVEVNGKFRVLNEVEYHRSWPDVLNKLNGIYMEEAEIERFKHGKYPYNNTSKGTYFCLENHRSILTNIYNGFIDCGKYTPVEEKAKKTVTFIGDSRIFCNTVPARLSIPYLLQSRFMAENINCEVKNFSTLLNSLQNVLAQLKSMELGKDDIILCATFTLGTYFSIRSIPPISHGAEDSDEVIRLKLMLMKEIKKYCDERGTELYFIYLPTVQEIPNMTELEAKVADSFDRTYSPVISHRKLLRLCLANDIKVIDFSEEFINTPRESHYIDERHFSVDTEKLIVDSLFEFVSDIVMRDEPLYNDKEFVDEAIEVHHRFVSKILQSHIDESEEFVRYLKSLSEGRSDNAGFILMNCNPFTLGHQYLVDEARKQVDDLYVMVVPEENPHFSYKDRFEIARRAVEKYDNVHMVRGGTAMGTRAQFPEYFEREKNPEAVVDLSRDIYTFCYQVAPALKVKKRFVGTEPKDFVTAQLNEQYKRELPDAGIELVEIPRKELNNRPVSASDVRRLLKEKKYDEIKAIVPETTYNYLRNELGL